MDRRRFRANFYADWDCGQAFREDELVGRTLAVGDRLRLAVLERDPRCKMITLDPETGARDSSVLRHLTKTRGGTLGVYAAVLAEVSKNKRIQPLLIGRPSPDSFVIDAWARGHIKQELLKIGWPAEDLAGYTPGTPHPIDLA